MYAATFQTLPYAENAHAVQYRCTQVQYSEVHAQCTQSMCSLELLFLLCCVLFVSQDFELDVLEEAYTTEHWIVRIYKVKDLDNRGGQ